MASEAIIVERVMSAGRRPEYKPKKGSPTARMSMFVKRLLEYIL
jgi:hypothetical protein